MKINILVPELDSGPSQIQRAKHTISNDRFASEFDWALNRVQGIIFWFVI